MTVSVQSTSAAGVDDAVVQFGTVTCVVDMVTTGASAAVVQVGIVVSVKLELADRVVGVLLAVMHDGTVVSVRLELADIVGVLLAVAHDGTVTSVIPIT